MIIVSTTISNSRSSQKIESTIQSMLDTDFDYDDEEMTNELDKYLSEKPANKEIDVLIWWKVSIYYYNI
jgi:hypothetical protein